MSGHAIQDALFLKNAHSEIKHRTARVEGSFAWIGTESELHAINDGKPLMLLSTENNTAEKFRCWLVDRAYSLVIATEEGSATSCVFAWGGHSRPRLIS